MYRRVVALLLLLLVPITQSVTLGHCPGSSSRSGHDPRPHVHLNHHVHEHHHGPCTHHHHEDSPESDDALPESPFSQPDHDSDALFFGGDDAVLRARSHPEIEIDSALCSCALDTTSLPASAADLAHLPVAAYYRPPPSSAPPCPLYVRHLTLLI